jgi:hypothetical protein
MRTLGPYEFIKEHRTVQELKSTVAQQQREFESKIAQQQKQIEAYHASAESERPA